MPSSSHSVERSNTSRSSEATSFVPKSLEEAKSFLSGLGKSSHSSGKPPSGPTSRIASGSKDDNSIGTKYDFSSAAASAKTPKLEDLSKLGAGKAGKKEEESPETKNNKSESEDTKLDIEQDLAGHNEGMGKGTKMALFGLGAAAIGTYGVTQAIPTLGNLAGTEMTTSANKDGLEDRLKVEQNASNPQAASAAAYTQ